MVVLFQLADGDSIDTLPVPRTMDYVSITLTSSMYLEHTSSSDCNHKHRQTSNQQQF